MSGTYIRTDVYQTKIQIHFTEEIIFDVNSKVEIAWFGTVTQLGGATWCEIRVSNQDKRLETTETKRSEEGAPVCFFIENNVGTLFKKIV